MVPHYHNEYILPQNKHQDESPLELESNSNQLVLNVARYTQGVLRMLLNGTSSLVGAAVLVGSDRSVDCFFFWCSREPPSLSTLHSVLPTQHLFTIEATNIPVSVGDPNLSSLPTLTTPHVKDLQHSSLN